MIPRLLDLPRDTSFFLFGARGTGKSTLLRERIHPDPAARDVLVYDLLDPEVEDRFARHPGALEGDVAARLASGRLEWVVIDEVQKAPRLLDVVHRLIEGRGVRFALSGSSARKLKRGGANLLAGRALVRHLHPLTERELGHRFDLVRALESGTLPMIYLDDDRDRRARRLRAYATTYLREEVQVEQLLRRLDPFRRFLEVAAQQNGKPLNYSAIAREIGLRDHKTVQAYFGILEDTLLGFHLPAFHRSVRKSQIASPKFYFFDLGVKRALDRTLDVPLHPQTSAFGEAFEHLVIAEVLRANEILDLDLRAGYLQTKDGFEVDLVLDKPGRLDFVEIKSADRVDPVWVARFARGIAGIPGARGYWLSRDPHPQEYDGVRCLEWREGIAELTSRSRVG